MTNFNACERNVPHGVDRLRERDATLTAMRNARFAHGVFCPRCLSRQTIRYGRFRGRQRYRCRTCHRTFSDLTLTPAAHCKRIDRWQANGQCMLDSLTVRKTARTIGVNPSTAFHWRHKNLGGLVQLDETLLRGVVEFVEDRIPYSEKGQRRLNRPPRRHGTRGRSAPENGIRKVTIVAGADRRGGLAMRVVVAGVVNVRDLIERFALRTLRGPVVIAHAGPLSQYARFALLRDGKYRDARVVKRNRSRSPLLHTTTSLTHAREFRKWLLPFRGVATRYLDNYLAWYGLLERIGAAAGIAGFMRWSLVPPNQRKTSRG